MTDVKGMKRYIGDAVYVEWDGWAFVLTTEDGIRATNRIVLETEVYEELTRFVADLQVAAARGSRATR